MKRALAVAAALALSLACQEKTAPEPPRQKTTAEKAFDAGQNAKKNAEKIKAEQEKKAKEAIEETNQ